MSVDQLSQLTDMDFLSPIKPVSIVFTDPSFPPSSSTLHNPALSTTKLDMLQICARTTWRRPGEIFADRKFSVINSICPRAIIQGALADCYFLASLCSLAKRPERVEKLLVSREPSADGCYAVAGYFCGVRKEVVLDDCFAFDPRTGQSPFSKPIDDQLWVMLLEKAWAKINGSFTNVEFGEEVEALEFLTGAPVECLVHATMHISTDDLWKRVVDADQRGYVLTCSTKMNQPVEKFRKAGLMQYHVYSIMKPVEMANPRGNASRLLIIRDQWQKTDWKGPYSRGSAEFLENAAALESELDDPNSFAMPIELYTEYFKETTICHYEDKYVHSTAEIANTEQSCYVFEVHRITKGYVAINQYHSRIFRLSRANDYCYSPAFLVLGKLDARDSSIRYVTSLVTISNTEYREVDLSPGKYIIMSGAEWKTKSIRRYNIHMYTNFGVTLQESDWNPENLVSMAQDFAETRKSTWKRLAHGLYHFERVNFALGFGISFVKNMAQGQRIYYEENTKATGLRRIHPDPSNRLRVTLKSGETVVSLFKFTSTSGYSYGYTYKYIQL